MKPHILIVLLFLLSPVLRAQTADTLTWEDFRAEYFDTDEGDDEAPSDEMENFLEELAETRIDINTARRETLLLLPFLTEAQADSILAFRERKHELWSLGELIYVNGLDYRTRRYLTLFLTVRPLAKAAPSLRQQFFGGRHDVSTRVDIPLYRRAGYQDRTTASSGLKEGKVYAGNGVANVVRYRYRFGNSVRYGVTLEKDAGEPFAQSGNYPYDYMSGYVQYAPPNARWRVLLGDYNLSWGQGLAASIAIWSNRTSLLDAPLRAADVFRPHTSTEENRFFRGMAAMVRLGRYRLSAFASLRSLDASMDGDTVRTLQTTGYHRTEGEREKKDKVREWMAGGRLDWSRRNVMLGISGFFTHYDKLLYPKLTTYNRYYLRGQTAAMVSADWRYAARRWSFSGEAAADKDFHLSLTQTLTYSPQDELSFTMQHRHLSPRFVSPYGRTQQAASRVCNEHGVYLGVRYGGLRRLDLRGYLDYARLPQPVYGASLASNRLEALAQITWTPQRRFSMALRYKVRSTQRDVTEVENLMQYVMTHRLRLRADWTPSTRSHLSIHALLDATFRATQTTEAEKGFGASLRLAWKPCKTLTTGFSGSLFFTDSYATAVYAYEPRFVYSYSMPALFDHGCRWVALVGWRLLPRLELSARAGMTHFFNRATIGSGNDEIASPTKTDLSLQVRWQF